MKTISRAAFLLMALMLVGCAHQNVKTEPLVLKTITFSSTPVIDEKIKAECDLPNTLSKYIKIAAEDSYPQILDSSSVASSQTNVLDVQITHVYGAPGGKWSGDKSVSIKATLTQNGKVVGNFTAARMATGSVISALVTGGFEGTCSLLRRCARTLGRDIGEWLEQPTIHVN